MDIGFALRTSREALGLRGREVARRADISVAMLSQVEAGARQPSLDVLRRLADALSVPLDALLLMAGGDETALRSDDGVAHRYVASLRRLEEAEKSLRAVLGGDDAP